MRQGLKPLADYRTNGKSRSPFQPLADYRTGDESRQLLLQSKKPTASKSLQCWIKYGDSSNN
jgi:hypothetical protein